MQTEATLRVMCTESSAGSRTRVQGHGMGPQTAVAAAAQAAGKGTDGPAAGGEAAGGIAKASEVHAFLLAQQHLAVCVLSSTHARTLAVD